MSIRRSAFAAVLLAVVWGATPALAQDHVGVLVGLNSANINFDFEGIDVNLDSRTGFAGGVYWTRAFSGPLGVEVDVLFAQKGTTLSDEDFGDEFKIKLTYVDVPVLARFDGMATPTVGFHGYAGPSFNFKVSESFEENGIEEEGDEDGVKSFEAALVVGGGVSFGRVRVDARYGLGLTSIADAEDIGFAASAKNRVVSILVGIELR